MTAPQLPTVLQALRKPGIARVALVVFGLALAWLIAGELGRPSTASDPKPGSAERIEITGAARPASDSYGTEIDLPRTAVDVSLKLILVLGLVYGTLALLRRYGGGLSLSQRTGQIRVLESSTLASNRSIYLVRVAGRQILLGVTPSQITTLADWDADSVPAETSLPPAQLN
jgi:flagellar biosynthetic protein FliO